MDEKRLIQDIDEIANNIRRKYRALKLGVRESEELLTKTYKPLLEPLTKLSEKLESRLDVKTPVKTSTAAAAAETPQTPVKTPHFLRTEVLAETPSATSTPDVTIEDFIATPEGRQLAREYVEQTVEGPLARKYLLMTLSDERERLMDHTYGVRSVDDR